MVTLVNRAKVSTATTGTGTITLGAAESGYQSFADAGVVDTNVVRYVIEDGDAWEIGSGTYTAAGTTLTRTVSESSNADAAISLTGSAVVYVSATAADLAPPLELYAENPVTPTAPSATGTNAVAIGSESVSVGLRSMSMGDSYASGTDSLAAAIANNTASYGATGTSSVAIGQRNKASATNALAIGYQANSTATWSTAIGAFCLSSSTSSVAIGNQNTASAAFSLALGRQSVADKSGKFAFTGHSLSSLGSSQTGMMVLVSDTTDATPEAITSNNSTIPSPTNQVILPNNSAYSFSGTIIARQQASAGSEYASWEVKGALLRDAAAATTVLGNGIKNKLFASTGAAAWDIALTADTVNGGLAITVTGAAATNIRWVATVNTSEVTY